ncbi:MAG TPA: AI-2E family transporter [Anaerolineales bacterium]|jgi:predicted PurR-regulated permease PerM
MTKRLVWFATAIMTTLLLVALLWQFRIVVVYVLISLMMVAALRPLFTRLAGRSLAVRVGWIFLYLVGLVGIGFLLFLAASNAVAEVQLLPKAVSAQNAWKLPEWLKNSASQLAFIALLTPPGQLLDSFTGDQSQLVLPVVLGFTQGLGGVVSDALIILFLSIYWGVHENKFERLWLSLVPSGQRTQVRAIWRTIEADLGAYIRSEFIQSLLAGLLLGLGYWMLGSPFPSLLALFGALVWFIPVIGGFLAVGLPLLLGLLTSVPLGLLAALFTFFILTVLQIWIEPRLFRREWNNPILTLVMLLLMADAFGLIGILIAPLLSVVCQILWDLLFKNRAISETTLRVSDLKERQARLWENTKELEGPSLALVTSSMDRLAQLLEKAEPILPAGLPAGSSGDELEPSVSTKP